MFLSVFNEWAYHERVEEAMGAGGECMDGAFGESVADKRRLAGAAEVLVFTVGGVRELEDDGEKHHRVGLSGEVNEPGGALLEETVGAAIES